MTYKSRTLLTAQGSRLESWTQDEMDDGTSVRLKRLDLDALGLADEPEEQDAEPTEGFNPYEKHR